MGFSCCPMATQADIAVFSNRKICESPTPTEGRRKATVSLAGAAGRASGRGDALGGAVRQPNSANKSPAQRISLWTGGITPSFAKHRQAAVRRVSEVGTIGSDGSALQLLRLAADARCSPLLPNDSCPRDTSEICRDCEGSAARRFASWNLQPQSILC